MMTTPTRVLFVDDFEPYINNVCSDLPKHLNQQLEVECVYSPIDAIDKVRYRKIDQVFVDIRYGKKPDGIDLCRKIKQDFPDKWVGMLTLYYKNMEYLEKCTNAGCDDFLAKIPDHELNLVNLSSIIETNNLRCLRNQEPQNILPELNTILKRVSLVMESLKAIADFYNSYRTSRYALFAIQYCCDALDPRYVDIKQDLMLNYGYWELARDSARVEQIVASNQSM